MSVESRRYVGFACNSRSHDKMEITGGNMEAEMDASRSSVTQPHSIQRKTSDETKEKCQESGDPDDQRRAKNEKGKSTCSVQHEEGPDQSEEGQVTGSRTKSSYVYSGNREQHFCGTASLSSYNNNSAQEARYLVVVDVLSPSVSTQVLQVSVSAGFTLEKPLHTFGTVYLAECGFAIVNLLNCAACPNCKLRVELPYIYINMLAVHVALSPSCPLAAALYNKQMQLTEDSNQVPAAKKAEISEYVVRRSNEPRNEPDSSIGSTDEDLIKAHCLKLWQNIDDVNMKRIQLKDNIKRSFLIEAYRKETFLENGFPESPRVQLVASNGLYLSGFSGDGGKKEIRCFHCNLRRDFRPEMLLEVEAASSLDKDHLNNNCGHINGSHLTGNIPDVCNLLAYQYGRQADASDLLSQTDSLNEFEGLGINVNLSKHPEMAVVSRRLATFLTYPYKSAKHPEQLVEGGYFYSGEGESVTCYSCGIVSADWTSRCDVFIRHARSSPTCAHVISTRGQQFVDDVLAEFGSYHSRPAEDKITTVTNRMLRPRMDSIPVQKTLDMGISSQAVRTVVAKRVKKGAPDFKYISEIVQEVKELNVPEGQLREAKDTSVVLPKVLNLPESESDKEEEVMSSADVQMDESAEQSSHVEDRTALSIETDKMEVVADVRTEATQLKSELLCKVCMTEPVSMIFLPCSHLTCCSICSAAMVNCPLCRKDVVGTIKIKFCGR